MMLWCFVGENAIFTNTTWFEYGKHAVITESVSYGFTMFSPTVFLYYLYINKSFTFQNSAIEVLIEQSFGEGSFISREIIWIKYKNMLQ